MTYAIVETGGKQYKTQAGGELRVEKLDAAGGKKIKLDKVLLIADKDGRWVGKPFVKGAFVEAQVLGTLKGPKVISYKAIRREGGAKTKIGHRQKLTKVKILSIQKP